jgi:hypothetical protein
MRWLVFGLDPVAMGAGSLRLKDGRTQDDEPPQLLAWVCSRHRE